MKSMIRETGPTPANPDRIHELLEQIAELKKSIPAHSTPPSMLLRLEELEEELEKELKIG